MKVIVGPKTDPNNYLNNTIRSFLGTGNYYTTTANGITTYCRTTANTYAAASDTAIGYCINTGDVKDGKTPAVYAIYLINEADLANYSRVKVLKNGEEIQSDDESQITEVYTSILFADGSTVTASQKGANYIVAIEIDDVGTLPDSLGFTLEPVTA